MRHFSRFQAVHSVGRQPLATADWKQEPQAKEAAAAAEDEIEEKEEHPGENGNIDDLINQWNTTLNITYDKAQETLSSIPNFREEELDTFSEFEREMNKFRYKNLCEYAECLPKYHDGINFRENTLFQNYAEILIKRPKITDLQESG